MADSKTTALTLASGVALTDMLFTVLDPSGSPVDRKITYDLLGGTIAPGLAGGRLTTESGAPISTSDRSAQSTLYYALYEHNNISLYDGTDWQVFAFTERSLALSGLTTDKNYDVFLYDNSGTLTMELSAAWTNDTTRADAITRQDGVWVKSGATTRRLLGTIRATAATTTEDSAAKRLVWNANNRVRRSLGVSTTTNSWTYATSTWRQANADTTLQVAWVNGLVELVSAEVMVTSSTGGGAEQSGVALGLDSTSSPSGRYLALIGESSALEYHTQVAAYDSEVALGYHYLAWLEWANVGTVTYYGDAIGAATIASGITGSIAA